MKKIGIMGGTFDPIHMGHLMLAEFARAEKKLDEIWFIPTGCSYMKSHDVISGADRMKMTELAIRDNDCMRCLDIEIKREGRTYSYETLEELAGMYPDYEFYFIIGADCLFQIEAWKCPEKIFGNAKVLASVRGGASEEKMQIKIDELSEKFGADIELLHFPRLEISSTDIRQRILEGKSIRYFVPDVCIEYIKEKGFYQNEK